MEVLSLFKNNEKKNKLLKIPIKDIMTNPHQPRKIFDNEKIGRAHV